MTCDDFFVSQKKTRADHVICYELSLRKQNKYTQSCTRNHDASKKKEADYIISYEL